MSTILLVNGFNRHHFPLFKNSWRKCMEHYLAELNCETWVRQRRKRANKNCDFLSHSEFRWFKLSQTVGLSKLFWWFWLFFSVQQNSRFFFCVVCVYQETSSCIHVCMFSMLFFTNKFEIDWYVKSNNSRKNFDYFMCDLPAVVEFSPNCCSLCLCVCSDSFAGHYRAQARFLFEHAKTSSSIFNNNRFNNVTFSTKPFIQLWKIFVWVNVSIISI